MKMKINKTEFKNEIIQAIKDLCKSNGLTNLDRFFEILDCNIYYYEYKCPLSMGAICPDAICPDNDHVINNDCNYCSHFINGNSYHTYCKKGHQLQYFFTLVRILEKMKNG